MTEYVRLGDVCDFLGGFPFDSKKFTDDKKQTPLLRIRDVLRGYTTTYTSEEFDRKYLVSDGDMLIGMDGDFNIGIWRGGSALLNQRVCKVTCDDIKIDSRYVFFLLKTHLLKIWDKTTYSTVKHLSIKTLQNLTLPLPSLEEQKCIAAALDKMSSVIAKRKRQIALLDEAAKSLFVEMFGDPVENPMGWEVDVLKELSTKIGSGSTPKGGNQSYVESGISFIRSLNVYNNLFKIKDLAHITPEQAKKLDNVTLQKDDVLINITGASVARSCIVPDDVLPARVNQHVSIIRCIVQKLNPVYLNYLLTDGNYQHILLSVGEAGGATREAITKSQLESLKIPLPPLDLQNLFAARIEALEAQRASCERGLKQMETAFAAMMQEYFE